MTITDVCNNALMRAGIDHRIDDYTNDPHDLANDLRRLYPTAAKKVLKANEEGWLEGRSWSTLGPTEYTKSYTGATSGTNDAGNTSFVVQETIDAGTPYSGTITVGSDTYSYVGWITSTFTLATGVALSSDYDDSDAVTTTPNNHDDRFERMYALPSDCLEALKLDNNPKIDFLVEGSYIFTNAYDATYGVRIQYMKDIVDESSNVVLYGEHIAEAISAELAYKIAPRGEEKSLRLLGVLMKEAEDELLRARGMDGKTSHPEPPPRHKWTDRPRSVGRLG